jgi:hypothetical protein
MITWKAITQESKKANGGDMAMSYVQQDACQANPVRPSIAWLNDLSAKVMERISRTSPKADSAKSDNAPVGYTSLHCQLAASML